ncbi:hypothetical protein SCLCIDRAFT_1216120 [Scleroderma citrinum Foug A]|uniref:Uncharacterized protein n=1 Tax=Scleroderma citrinum Foug A TaxID=1036808 RepID=A0A0C2ZHW4_9AGAM|nr:hypothetical protein SCLCIDRAFT_1216120 [Scleroderma citrinum Foug A]
MASPLIQVFTQLTETNRKYSGMNLLSRMTSHMIKDLVGQAFFSFEHLWTIFGPLYMR